MKCISLWQPWASAIPLGLKRIETRGWSTNVRGRIGIHAAKRWTLDIRQFIAQRRDLFPGELPEQLPLGAVIATAVLVDVQPTEVLLARGVSGIERAYGDFRPGRFGWILEDVVALKKPIEVSGMQGFFVVPDELFPAAARQEPTPAQHALFPAPRRTAGAPA
jgi:hypothetical protein